MTIHPKDLDKVLGSEHTSMKQEPWLGSYATLIVCDVANNAKDAALLLQMLGLLDANRDSHNNTADVTLGQID